MACSTDASILQDHEGSCAERAGEHRYRLAAGLEKVGAGEALDS
jgi:hypothetical protein